ncbi:hypothetical protein [Shimia sp.]|uniref:hypothetical protein n=1 Tax=Shimia sp. TaxID=1954381 RepID=UPI00329A4A06
MKRFLMPLAALAVAGTQAGAAGPDFLDDWDLDANGGVTWEELIELRKHIFETFDKDGDGALNNAEYTEFDKARAATAERTGAPLALRAVHGFGRNNFDTNLDGKVTRDEFEAGLRRWFSANDKNGDGILAPGDY